MLDETVKYDIIIGRLGGKYMNQETNKQNNQKNRQNRAKGLLDFFRGERMIHKILHYTAFPSCFSINNILIQTATSAFQAQPIKAHRNLRLVFARCKNREGGHSSAKILLPLPLSQRRRRRESKRESSVKAESHSSAPIRTPMRK